MDLTLAEMTELRVRGMPVYLAHVPARRSLGVYLRVACGFGDDPVEKAGLAHLCEHERITHASSIVSPLGPTIHGQTNAAWTDYRLSLPTGYWQHGLQLMLALLHPGRLTEARLANERRAVIIEIARSSGRPALRLGPLLASAAAAGSDIAMVSAATAESVGGLGIRDVDGFVYTHYRPANCRLVVASPVGSDEIAEFVADRLPATDGDSAPMTVHGQRPAHHADAAQSGTLAMTIHLPHPSEQTMLAHQLAHGYLTDTHGLVDRVSARAKHRVAGATTLLGRRSRFTALSWGAVAQHRALSAALMGTLGPGCVLHPEDFTDVRERHYSRRSYELQTSLGMAGQILRWVAGEDTAPLTREALSRVSVEQVNEALEELCEAITLWKVTDGVPQRVER